MMINLFNNGQIEIGLRLKKRRVLKLSIDVYRFRSEVSREG